MSVIEIIVIITAVTFVLAVIGNYIYKRVKHKPTGECASCANRMRRALKNGIDDISKECNCNKENKN